MIKYVLVYIIIYIENNNWYIITEKNVKKLTRYTISQKNAVIINTDRSIIRIMCCQCTMYIYRMLWCNLCLYLYIYLFIFLSEVVYYFYDFFDFSKCTSDILMYIYNTLKKTTKSTHNNHTITHLHWLIEQKVLMFDYIYYLDIHVCSQR